MKAAKFGLVLLLVIGVVAAVLRFGASSAVSDRVLIDRALDEAILASKEGRPGGVLDLLSRNLEVNGEPIFQRGEIADFIKKQKPEVTIERAPLRLSEDGKTAEMKAPVTMTLRLFTLEKSFTFREVTFRFAKEEATEYLVIPTKKWRIQRVTASDFDPAQFEGLSLGG
ncbi:MAG: hypothetical protein KIS66_12705 [Fimbriimonadaceae bacterium]|nr:hypothetical protein [Fimbriimonadaceae bacterium]